MYSPCTIVFKPSPLLVPNLLWHKGRSVSLPHTGSAGTHLCRQRLVPLKSPKIRKNLRTLQFLRLLTKSLSILPHTLSVGTAHRFHPALFLPVRSRGIRSDQFLPRNLAPPNRLTLGNPLTQRARPPQSPQASPNQLTLPSFPLTTLLLLLIKSRLGILAPQSAGANGKSHLILRRPNAQSQLSTLQLKLPHLHRMRLLSGHLLRPSPGESVSGYLVQNPPSAQNRANPLQQPRKSPRRRSQVRNLHHLHQMRLL